MTTIRLTNTRTRTKETFVPIDPANVRMYVCGPTVYDRAHLGNARPVVVFDVLFRLLRHVYGEGHVTYVRNFTDVDDRINDTAAQRRAAGEPGTLEDLIRARSDETIRWYHEDMGALGTLPPTHEPRATEYIAPMVTMIEGLIASGHAYEAQGHVLFRVRSYPDYGKLSGRSLDDMIAGARVEVAPYKEDPMDFVLWKPSGPELPGWDSPWGRGRPGWHIECSAMADELLMKDAPEDQKSFDIHAGGIDLQFPHHENEIAQSACAHPHGDFAKVWMHNEMLMVEGRKMSKSLGNFFTVRDLLDQGIDGEVIRLVLLKTHYRKPMDWTERTKNEAIGHLTTWNRIRRLHISDLDRKFTGQGADPAVVDALSDDLNIHGALTLIHRMASLVAVSVPDKQDSSEAVRLFESLALLGFNHLDPHRSARRAAVAKAYAEVVELPELQERLVEHRQAAMASNNFSTVDALKSALIAAGVEVRMSKSGVELVPGPDFDPSKLEALK